MIRKDRIKVNDYYFQNKKNNSQLNKKVKIIHNYFQLISHIKNTLIKN